ANDDTPQYATFTYDTNIQQPIIALCLPCVLNSTSIELRITNNDLNWCCLDYLIIHLQNGAKSRVTKTQPGSNKQVSKHTKAFGAFLLDRMNYLTVDAKANH